MAMQTTCKRNCWVVDVWLYQMRRLAMTNDNVATGAHLLWKAAVALLSLISGRRCDPACVQRRNVLTLFTEREWQWSRFCRTPTPVSDSSHQTWNWVTFCDPATQWPSSMSGSHLEMLAIIHRVSKNCAKLFCHNFVKFPPTLIIFGTLIAERIHLCDVHLFSTSPNSRQRHTVLNADAPNCYITL